jgi:DNA-binding transcriptional LysR family regulator
MDSLSALGVFVRVAETRSFTDAGRRLSVSSSAIGKTITRLEERMGIRLFHRNTRSITLTSEGELFLESCRRIFSEINRIELELSQSKATPKGRLKVSFPDVGMLMTPTLHGFMREYPEIQIDAEFTDTLVDVIDGGYDAVIRSGEQTDSRLMSRRLGSYRLEVVGSASYFARHGTPATPEDLKSHACLHHRYPSSGKLQRWPFAKVGPYADIELPISAAVTTIEPLVSLAELGIGLACLPRLRRAPPTRGRLAGQGSGRIHRAHRSCQRRVAFEPAPLAEAACLHRLHGRTSLEISAVRCGRPASFAKPASSAPNRL